MSNLFRAYLNEQNGASAAECAMAVAIVGALIAPAATLADRYFAGAGSQAVNLAATCVRTHSNVLTCLG
jgi:Flp pilus assembly pilin Flp